MEMFEKTVLAFLFLEMKKPTDRVEIPLWYARSGNTRHPYIVGKCRPARPLIPIQMRNLMADVMNELAMRGRMNETEQKVRFGIGAAAAAVAIFAPLSYRWKGVLTAIAAETIVSAALSVSPAKSMMRAA